MESLTWKRYKNSNTMVSSSGRCYNLVKRKFVSSVTGKGYLRFSYGTGSGKKYQLIHRAVAELFIDNPEGKEQVNHKDLNKKNNTIGNLEWATRMKNLQHSYDNGMKRVGVNHGSARFKEQDIHDIRMLANEFTHAEISRYYGVARTTITAICRGKNWSHISRKNDPGLSLSMSMDNFRELIKKELKQ